jgi:hypothetical protein
MLLARLVPVARSGLRVPVHVLALSTCACMQLPRPPMQAPATTSVHAREPVLPQESSTRGAGSLSEGFPLVWNPGQALLQGYIGASYLSEFQVNPSGAPPIELAEDEYEVLPVVGGGAQLKLAGRALDFGVEGFVAFSGRTNLEAFASSGGSTIAVFDVSLLVVEAYGGPFVSRFAGDRLRLYAGAGPLLQWVGYEQDDDSSDLEDDDAEGFGGGVYARGGLEFLLPSRKLVGFGARWSESSIDLDGEFGDLDLSGLELFVSYSYGLEPRSRFVWD